MMSLEVESGASLGVLSEILCFMGASFEISETHVIGNFEISNCYFVFRRLQASESITAEGAGLGWCVGIGGAFHCRADVLSESWADIKSFLVNLSKRIELGFVLSFQYESIYAIRDGGDVVFVKQMVE
ncbi:MULTISPECIES: hypothetical protein [Pseudomonas]|uniref:hypothetical protein n=1 Tax=Pseudomonas TaxID=286 RepID=UPI000695B872|nr:MULTISPECIES: hypothetical protein [Pseudomonas]